MYDWESGIKVHADNVFVSTRKYFVGFSCPIRMTNNSVVSSGKKKLFENFHQNENFRNS